jgi:hypothetical protein
MKPVLQQQSQSQDTTQRKDEVKWVKFSINNLNNLISEKYTTCTLYVFLMVSHGIHFYEHVLLKKHTSLYRGLLHIPHLTFHYFRGSNIILVLFSSICWTCVVYAVSSMGTDGSVPKNAPHKCCHNGALFFKCCLRDGRWASKVVWLVYTKIKSNQWFFFASSPKSNINNPFNVLRSQVWLSDLLQVVCCDYMFGYRMWLNYFTYSIIGNLKQTFVVLVCAGAHVCVCVCAFLSCKP